ncbi:MAG: winged helix-turn-helix domain-containing protein [Nitrospira sp. CG24D]|nr:MAG: winged helix-turn-helix domain-containing protein [Nitrospira sp. CG24D]
MVSAILGQFRDEGLVRMDGRTMTIVNQEGLRSSLDERSYGKIRGRVSVLKTEKSL